MNRALGIAGVIVGFGGAFLGIIVLATGLRTQRESLLRMGRSYAAIVLGGLLPAPVLATTGDDVARLLTASSTAGGMP